LLACGAILCRLPLGNGQNSNKKNRPREKFIQNKNLFSDETELIHEKGALRFLKL
jgi:hypothetical protein